MKNNESNDNMDELISAYVDGELVQQDEQRVRVYLEDNPEAKKKMEKYLELKGGVKQLKFKTPDEDEWENFETPHGSGYWRFLGVSLVLIAYLALAGAGLFDFFVDPDEELLTKTLVGMVVGGFGILFFSVLRQRILEKKTDKYTQVEK